MKKIEYEKKAKYIRRKKVYLGKKRRSEKQNKIVAGK